MSADLSWLTIIVGRFHRITNTDSIRRQKLSGWRSLAATRLRVRPCSGKMIQGL